jgi:hypothetical protein
MMVVARRRMDGARGREQPVYKDRRPARAFIPQELYQRRTSIHVIATWECMQHRVRSFVPAWGTVATTKMATDYLPRVIN